MDLNLVCTVEPTGIPVSVAEAKSHLRVSHAADDAYIESLIRAAATSLEYWYGHAYIPRTYRLSGPTFPCRAVSLPYPPVLEVVSVAYVDGTGAPVTLSSSAYTVDTDGACLVPAYGTTWPLSRGHVNDVTITYRAGYQTIPYNVRLAVLRLVSTWYFNRETVSDKPMARVPDGVELLLGTTRAVFV